jgi:squalene-hopene/tetraprenyl-beta-curcumene cyclase
MDASTTLLLPDPYVALHPAVLGEARRALDRAIDHALATQHAEGYWEAAADARILDTAIVAQSIAAGRAEPDRFAAYGRARRWLQEAQPQRHEPVVHQIDQWLRDLVTHETPEPPAAPDISSQKYAGRALLIQAIAVSAGAPGADAAGLLAMTAAVVQKAGGGQLKQWQRVILTAAEIIGRTRLGASVPRSLVAALEEEQRSDGSFCLMPAVTGIAYMALRATKHCPGAARRCLDHILQTQSPDGTWRFVSNDIWDTTLTLRSLRGESRFDRCAVDTAADFVERAQDPDGGWSFKRSLEADNDSTGAALLALAGTRQGRRAWPAAQAFARWTQRANGLWTTWQSADDTPALDATAHMVAGLDAHDPTAVDTAEARNWLASNYHHEWAWKVEWYSPTGYAVAEIAAAIGWAHDRTVDAIGFLVEHQHDDGGWATVPGDDSSGLAATGLALSAIANSGVIVPTETITAALGYIIDSQRGDGSWAGAPMMYGPRPFLVHFPTHTHAFVAAGLRDLLARS